MKMYEILASLTASINVRQFWPAETASYQQQIDALKPVALQAIKEFTEGDIKDVADFDWQFLPQVGTRDFTLLFSSDKMSYDPAVKGVRAAVTVAGDLHADFSLEVYYVDERADWLSPDQSEIAGGIADMFHNVMAMEVPNE